eukprot:Gb_27659 [translate_table: standard]
MEKLRDLYCKVLTQRPGNVYVANDAVVVLAKKGFFDVSKDIFTKVQEAAAGNIFVQMRDVWFSTSTLQEIKQIANEARQAVSELKNTLCLFNQLSAVTRHHSRGFDEKKIEIHVEYCKHLLDITKVHQEVVEGEEQQTRQKLELAHNDTPKDEVKEELQSIANAGPSQMRCAAFGVSRGRRALHRKEERSARRMCG